LVFFACGLVGPSLSGASTTIGQLAPGTSPPASCGGGPFDSFNQTVTSGSSYVVPSTGVKVTSWSTNAAAAGVGQQMLEMKIFRKVAEPLTYKVVGHDGPHPITPGVLNSFPTSQSSLAMWSVSTT